MREPIKVLDALKSNANKNEYRYKRIYRNLYNPEFYLQAYQNIYPNQGSLTLGADKITLDGLSEARIDDIIKSIKNHTYRPQPARRTYISKKNSKKMRPLGIASGNDKLVQEIIRMILESIYEPEFSEKSHGFRPNRSCHTALKQIESTFTATRWFIEGDITACFDSFEHQIIINILRKRIMDENFIELMWKFLKAGYMEQWEFKNTHSGVPQGAGMSPILANVYLNELDRYMQEYNEEFDNTKHKPRLTNPVYSRISAKIYRKRNKNKATWDKVSPEEKKARIKELKKLQVEQLAIPAQLAIEGGRKKLIYVRYADDFLVGVHGNKNDAERVKIDIGNYLKEKLGLELSINKTRITHTSKKARFLGYDIKVQRDKNTKKDKIGRCMRYYYGKVRLYVPHEKWKSKLLEYNAITIVKEKGGKERWKAISRGELTSYPDVAILSRYNDEIRGYYNYYAIANNASVIGKFAGLMKYSMLKTFAHKYRTSSRKIKNKYNINGEFTVLYTNREKEKALAFYNKGYKKQKWADKAVDDATNIMDKYSKRKSIINRLLKKYCEYCDKPVENVEIHQVKKLKELTGKSEWERIMIKKRRKTLVVCENCHKSIHNEHMELA